MDALECVRNLTAMLLMAAAQAVDLRCLAARSAAWGEDRAGCTGLAVRRVIDFENEDRAKEREVAELAANLPG